MKSVKDMSMEELAAFVCSALKKEGIETVCQVVVVLRFIAMDDTPLMTLTLLTDLTVDIGK
jgi:hypothetical protein